MAGGSWRRLGRATNAAAGGLGFHIFYRNGFWVLLVVGEGQGRQAGRYWSIPENIEGRL